MCMCRGTGCPECYTRPRVIRIAGTNLKTTYTLDSHIAMTVLDDYQHRGIQDLKTEVLPYNGFLSVDFGGFTLTTQEPVTCNGVRFFPHQHLLVRDAVESALAAPRGSYVKIHSLRSCICMSEEGAYDLLDALRSEADSYELLAEKQFTAWECLNK